MSGNDQPNIPPVKEAPQTWFEWLKDNKFAVIFGILILVALYYWYTSGSSVACPMTDVPSIPTTTEGGFTVVRLV